MNEYYDSHTMSIHSASETSEKDRTTITIDEKIKKVGQKLAKEENRSFSNYIETLILRDKEISEAGKAVTETTTQPEEASA